MLLAAVALGGAGVAWPQSAAEIMRQERDRHRLNDEEEMRVLRLVSKTGAVKERKVVLYTLAGPDDLRKSLVRFLAPRDVENTGLLTWEARDGDDDQWLYLPATRKAKRIAASAKKNSFMGTDFAYEDLRSENPDVHRYTLVGSETVDGRDCLVIEAVPATEKEAANSGYSRRKLWLQRTRSSPSSASTTTSRAGCRRSSSGGSPCRLPATRGGSTRSRCRTCRTARRRSCSSSAAASTSG
jgi:hypothetical protein